MAGILQGHQMTDKDSQFRSKLKEFAELEAKHAFLGIRFRLHEWDKKHTTEDLLDLAWSILNDAIWASREFDSVPVRGPVIVA